MGSNPNRSALARHINGMHRLQHAQSAFESSFSISSAVYWNGDTLNRANDDMKSARDTPAITAAFSCDIIPSSYHFIAVASRWDQGDWIKRVKE